jgi:asparagine synthetase B (glutamine-hydrolysing)
VSLAPLTSLEIASGLVFGGGDRVMEEPATSMVDPLAALEQAVLPALTRPPCIVSFSGGRDSSAVLAIAMKVAQREGLPAPIPVTNRFRHARASEESGWQRRVVAHVGCSEWMRLSLNDELDAIGPIARKALRRHGLLWPFNAHFHVPILEAARGGSLLTGIGGDELLGAAHWARPAAVLAGTVRPRPRDALRIGVALSPAVVRRVALTQRAPRAFPWLTESAGRDLRRAWAQQTAHEPMRWRPRWRWWRSLRSAQIGFASLDRLAGDVDVRIRHPLADAAFALAAARLASRQRIFERTPLFDALFRDLLPEAVRRRATKAQFDRAFWGPSSREWAARWDGRGVDTDVVDASGLVQTWSRPVPDPHSFLLLQSLWLDAERGALTPAA